MVDENPGLQKLKAEKSELEDLIASLSVSIKLRATDGTKSFSIESSAGSRRVDNIPIKELMDAKDHAQKRLGIVTREIEEQSSKAHPRSRFIQTRF